MDEVDYSKDYTELVQTSNSGSGTTFVIELENHCVDFIIINVCLNCVAGMPDTVQIEQIDFEGPSQPEPVSQGVTV